MFAKPNHERKHQRLSAKLDRAGYVRQNFCHIGTSHSSKAESMSAIISNIRLVIFDAKYTLQPSDSFYSSGYLNLRLQRFKTGNFTWSVSPFKR
jgi:hypothetical protein